MSVSSVSPCGGFVYVAESTRPDGSKQIYTGMTRRHPYERWTEHMQGRGGGYTSRGTYFKPLGAKWFPEPYKMEREIKKWSSSQKRAFGRAIAKEYYRNLTKV
jgi:predicted GIY-YIG superfamily endonuclease